MLWSELELGSDLFPCNFGLALGMFIYPRPPIDSIHIDDRLQDNREDY